MKTIQYVSLVICALFCVSCELDAPKKIAQVSDYNTYVEAEDQQALLAMEAEYAFWDNKINAHPNQFPYLVKRAASLTSLFKMTGKIDYLIQAESDLVLANIKTHYKTSGYLRALARNYISQHRFKEALSLLEKSETIGEGLKGTEHMLFDVHLELGNTTAARTYLNKNKKFNDFDYLIRLAKWQDHEGDLNGAIKYMERAMTIAESSNSPHLKKWVYTNIADFYGHDGQIEKSYQYYLKTLELDPLNAYAKKGIAWIVYSNDKNPEEAMRILNKVSKQYEAPDYALLKAEIAEYMENDLEKAKHLNAYLETVKDEKYGAMYNAYNTLVYTDDLLIFDTALKLAEQEVANRPTPHAYDLLAWTYYKKGEYKKALSIVEEHVAGKSSEPAILYHVAQIYKDNGKLVEAKNLKTELLAASYELGPVLTADIKNI